MTTDKEWLFTADSSYFSCTEKVYTEKRLNHLCKFVKKAHDRNFLKENIKPSYIHDRVKYRAWQKLERTARLKVTIEPYTYANAQ